MKATTLGILTFLLVTAPTLHAHAASPAGSTCSTKADCASGHCYPGPKGQKYCIHRDWNCAWPGHKGAVFGEVYYYEGTYNFCRSSGLRSYPAENKDDFILTRSDLRWTAKPDSVGFKFTCDEDGKKCSPSLFSVPSGGKKGSTKQGVRDGYAYCNHDMRVLSQNPEKGKYRPRYGVGPVTIDGITVWYELPSRPVGQGRTWLGLQTFVLAVKKDAVEAYRKAGLCRVP